MAAWARLVGYSTASLAAADVAAFQAATAAALGLASADVAITAAADADGALPLLPPAASRRRLHAAAPAVLLSYQVALATADGARSVAAALAAGGGASLALLRAAGLTSLMAVDAPSMPVLLLPSPPPPGPPGPHPPPRAVPAWPPASPPASPRRVLNMDPTVAAITAAFAMAALLALFCAVVACRVSSAREHERIFKATEPAARASGDTTAPEPQHRGVSLRVADVSAVLVVPPAAVLAPHDAEHAPLAAAHRAHAVSRGASAAPGGDANAAVNSAEQGTREDLRDDDEQTEASQTLPRVPSLPRAQSPLRRLRAKSPGLGRWLQNPIFWLMSANGQGGDAGAADEADAAAGDGERRGSAQRRARSSAASRRGTAEAAQPVAQLVPPPMYYPPPPRPYALSSTRREQLLAELGVAPM